MTFTPEESRFQPAAWRDYLAIHPAAIALPPLGSDELDALAEDINAHGMHVKPVLRRDPRTNEFQLLDGRNRLDAAADAGINMFNDDGSPNLDLFDIYAGDDPLAFVIGANLHRRQLSKYDLKRYALELLKDDAARSDRAIAKLVGLHHETIAAVREGAEASGEFRHIEPTGRARRTAVNRAPGRRPPRCP